MKLSKLKSLCDAATPGPWDVMFGEEEDGEIYCGASLPKILTIEGDGGWYMNDTDANFISTARTELPRLISLLESALPLLQLAHRCDRFVDEYLTIGQRRELRQLIKDIEGE